MVTLSCGITSIECSTDHLLGEKDYAALRRLLSSFGLQDHYLNSLQQEEC